MDQIVPHSLQKEATLPMPCFGTPSPLSCKRIHFSHFKPHSLWHFITSAAANTQQGKIPEPAHPPPPQAAFPAF